jgi:hypothetical protein
MHFLIKDDQSHFMTHLWVRGPQLPDDVVAEDVLTPEDHKYLTLDHIDRTSDCIARIEIRMTS